MANHSAIRAGVTALLSILAVGIAGCSTSLESHSINTPREEMKDKLPRGLVYYLPRTEYQIQVSREIESCSTWYASTADAGIAWLYSQLTQLEKQGNKEDENKFLNNIGNDPIWKNESFSQKVNSILKTDKFQVENSPSTGSKTKSTKAALTSIALKLPKVEHIIEASAKAQLTTSLFPDTAHAYYMSYELMQSGLKGTDYAVELYPNGTLKSVNITIDDQTGPAINSILTGTVKLLASASGFTFATPQNSPPNEFQSFTDWKKANETSPCEDAVRIALSEKSSLMEELKAATAEVLTKTKELESKTDAYKEAVDIRDKAKEKLKGFDPKDTDYGKFESALKDAESALRSLNRSVQEAKDEVTQKKPAVEKIQAKIERLNKTLVYNHTTTIRPTRKKIDFELPGENEAIKKWLKGEAGTICLKSVLPPMDEKATALCKTVAQLKSNLMAFANIYSPGTMTDVSSGEYSTGIYYRQPVKSQLMACKGRRCLNPNNDVRAVPEEILLNSPVEIPQLGALAYLPLANNAFQNNTISASFAENGTVTKVTYKSNAALAKAAEVFETSADTISKFKDAKRLQETTKLNASAAELESRKKVIDAQLALEKAQRDLEDFRQANPDKN